MQKQHLEQEIAKAIVVVEKWKANQNSIEAQIANANARLAKAAAHRKEFALDASLGNAKAVAEIAKARTEHAVADGDLKDLAVALDGAAQRLVEAEAEARKANRALAKFEAEALKHQRIHMAGSIDGAIADLTRLLAEFESLGEDIANKDAAAPNIHGMSSDNSQAIGWRRVAAAMPASMARLYPGAHHDEIQKMPLALSEARFWNLQPEHPKAKVA
jgi:chromosome segregation ATPase